MEESALREIVSRAAFLHERVAENTTPSKGGQELVEKRLQNWLQNAASGNADLFAKRLGWDGLDEAKARALLSCGETRDGAPESWTDTLQGYSQTAFECSGDSQEQLAVRFKFLDGESPNAFEELLAPLVLYASRTLRTQAPAFSKLLSEPAQQSFEAVLLRNLSSISAETLDLEFSIFRSQKQALGLSFGSWAGSDCRQLYSEFVSTMLKTGLPSFWLGYAVLARFSCIITKYWIEATAEFVGRLEQDLKAIGQRFCSGRDPGRVAEIRAGLSDRHNRGRVTLRVKFESGLTLFYKPKDLATEERFNELLGWINKKQISLPFRLLGLLGRSGYGWAEEVPHLACEREQDVQNYFHRAGMLLGLVYALEGTDCHNENIIACGDQPILIDAESLLQPRIRMEGDGVEEGANSLANRMFYWDSVFRTALLPRWEFGTGGESYDVSGLGGVRTEPTSIQMPYWEHINTDLMRLKFHKVQTSPKQNIVRLGDVATVPRDYVDSIVGGFDEIYSFLLKHSADLFAADGPLAQMSSLPVRFIYRNTKVYAVILKSLFRPQHLRDGIDMSIRVEVLARAVVNSDWPDAYSSIYYAERDAMLNCDIPFFTGRTNSDELIMNGSRSVPGFFLTPSFELLRERFDGLGEADRERQIAYIRAAFQSSTQAASAGAKRQPISAVDLNGTDHPSLPVGFIAEAKRIAEAVRSSAILSSDGSATWITMAYFAEAQRWQLQPMTPRLYDGITGVALFLAGFEKATGTGEFRDLALRALASVERSFADAFFDRVLFEPGIGAGLGAASVLYSFVKCSALLGERQLLSTAGRIAEMITAERIENDIKLDLLSGSAGAAVSLLALHEITNDVSVLSKATACGDRLLTARVETESGHKSWLTLEGKPVTGFSHGTAGIAYALVRLYQATSDVRYLDAAREGCLYEHSQFDETCGNWPDLRYSPVQGKHTFQCSWCHGAPGIALGRLGVLPFLHDQEIRKDLDLALHTTAQEPVTDIDHLCCGNLGRAEVLLAASQRLHDPTLKESATTIAGMVVRRADLDGQYSLGWQHGPYLPSFHQGMAESGINFCDSHSQSCRRFCCSNNSVWSQNVSFDLAEFPFAKTFEENTDKIKAEFLGIGRKMLNVHRKLSHEAYVALAKANNGWMPSWQVDSDTPNLQWLTYGLCYRGIFPDEAQEKFPETAAILRHMGGSLIVAAFSLMGPRSFIAPHRHPELGGNLLTYHLGVNTTPKRSFLNVDGTFFEEREGTSVIFDGSRDHFAINMGESERVILYMEFDRSKMPRPS